jgi:hypothetical protein
LLTFKFSAEVSAVETVVDGCAAVSVTTVFSLFLKKSLNEYKLILY